MRKSLHRLKRALHVSVVLAGIMFVVSGMQGAGAQDVTQGYQADGPLQNGIMIRLQPDAKTKVEPLVQEHEMDMFGVVVSSSEAPVSISDPAVQQVFVANFGQYDVLVSNQNGDIHVGDAVVISSIEGVGMKVDDVHRLVVGRALENFSDNSDAERHTKLSDGRTIALGRISVDIGIKRNPSFSGDSIVGVPHVLSRVAHAVTDKPVTALRIYAGLAILIICLVIAGAVLYSGIRSGMTSIGRNPLAKRSILRNLITVTLVSLIVVSIGLFAVYLILKI